MGGEGGKYLISRGIRGFPEFVLHLELSKIDDYGRTRISGHSRIADVDQVVDYSQVDQVVDHFTFEALSLSETITASACQAKGE